MLLDCLLISIKNGADIMSQGRKVYEAIIREVEKFKVKNSITDIWYRGENQIFDKMVPSMYRSGVLPENAYTEPSRLKLHISEKVNILEYERWLYEKIVERTTFEHPGGYKHRGLQDWDIVFYQQHYGLPTRFMDWSYTLETGLYFATNNDGVSGAVLWLLDPRKLNYLTRDAYELRVANEGEYEQFLQQIRWRAEQQLPVSITANPSQVVQRMYNQKGTFVFAGLEYVSFRDFVEDKTSLKGLETIEVLDKIIIPASDCKSLHEYLDIELGINKQSFGLNEEEHLPKYFSYSQFLIDKE